MSEETTTRQLVVFTLAGNEYALPITEVQEIIRWLEPRPVAAESEWIRGVISLRGKIVPVCDLASRLGLHTDAGDSAKIVIVETPGGTAGVIVDEVDEVLTIDLSQLDEVPGSGADFISKVAKVGDKLVLLLDAAGIFRGVDVAAAA